MSMQKPTPVPPPSTDKFENGIAHPALWLWDSWTAELDGTVHLYCLALSRFDSAGDPVLPEHRNDYPFHIRHFTSEDRGRTWNDKGVFLQPSPAGDGAFARNVWSGGVLARGKDDWVVGFTGLRDAGANRPFQQSICIGHSHTPNELGTSAVTTLSCPLRDYDLIKSAGYYLPPKESLGAYEGEEGGPILAWRDPFILDSGAGQLEIFWSAKIGPARSAVAHATVRQNADTFEIEKLHPPMTLPDDGTFTQAEVPKVYLSPGGGTCFMMISACDRLNESQPAENVSKMLRLYKSSSIRGPWTPAFVNNGSVILATENLFGASIFRADFNAGELHMISPYSEYESEDKQLTFAPVKVIKVPREPAEFVTTPHKQPK